MRKIRIKNNLDIKEKNINLLDLVEERIKNSLDSLKRKKTIDEILDIYEKQIDGYILEVSKLEKLNYISGYLTVKPTNKVIAIKIECYFQDKRKAWVKKESVNLINRDNILDEGIENIESKYEIESPLNKMGGR